MSKCQGLLIHLNDHVSPEKKYLSVIVESEVVKLARCAKITQVVDNITKLPRLWAIYRMII